MDSQFNICRQALEIAAPGNVLIADAAVDERLQVPGCLGWVYSSGVVTSVRDHLMERGDWFEGAEAIVVDTEMIAAVAAEHGYEFGELLVVVVLHERAHQLAAQLSSFYPLVARVISADEPAIAAFRASGFDEAKRWFPWGAHGERFTRICIHLERRVMAAGFDLPAPCHLMYGGTRYGLPPAWRLSAALGDEPERMAGRTFAEIDDQPAPKAFTDIFQDCLEFHRSLQDSA
jgi:hypothetical protein